MKKFGVIMPVVLACVVFLGTGNASAHFGAIIPPADPYVTQVIKADKNGVFSYAMPRAGWWGFAALNEASWTMKDPDGKDKPIEIGAVYWVRVRDMK